MRHDPVVPANFHATCGRGCIDSRDVYLFDAMRIRALIKALGGPTYVANELGVALATVGNWSLRNNIPAEYHIPIWRLAMAKDVAWKPPNTDGVLLAPESTAPPSSPAKAA